MEFELPYIIAVVSLFFALSLITYLRLSAGSNFFCVYPSALVSRPLTVVSIAALICCGQFFYFPSQANAMSMSQSDLTDLSLPDDFVIELYVSGVKNARQMAMGDKGTLFIGTRNEGKVYAVRDTDGDSIPDTVQIIGHDLFMPAGVAFRDGDLYVAEVDKIWRYVNIESSLPLIPKPELVYDKLPNRRAHGWKFIAFGPDGQLYIPIGSPCNSCDAGAPYARIVKVDLETMVQTDVALGVRNSVGFDWHPFSGRLWFSDNGRDRMGDDLPDDEINVVTQSGQHFGYPYVHAGTVIDPDYGVGVNLANYEQPVAKLGAHVAALGIHFYRGSMFPEPYRHALFVAQHGSWNRSKKVGYQVNVLTVKDSQVIHNRPFVTGWLKGEKFLGRPVAFLELDDGSLLLSDDYAGVVYRISYQD